VALVDAGEPFRRRTEAREAPALAGPALLDQSLQ
jgi:hypothetical protein